jgi:hypothetical protein
VARLTQTAAVAAPIKVEILRIFIAFNFLFIFWLFLFSLFTSYKTFYEVSTREDTIFDEDTVKITEISIAKIVDLELTGDIPG